jgi:pimeloyl-ACP methyl ester carboxylesterase
VVYIPGTQRWAPKTGTNPFDLTSNLSAISKTGSAGSERAVALAMTQAGIGPDSKVLLVGHSQGGMVAANISTRFAGSKVLTFGSPLGQLTGKLAAPTLSVEHERDPVPKLDSRPNALAANWVTVRQEFAGADPIAQHEMAGYLATARDIDEKPVAETGLVRLRQEISGFAGENAGQAYFFELRREP